VKPVFEFGAGLSYTKFEYSGLVVNRAAVEGVNGEKDWRVYVTFTVKNVGPRTGAEIAQVYLSVPETENFTGGYRSPLVLKGFAKTEELMPGQSIAITVSLDARAFSYWKVGGEKDGEWVVENGKYGIAVGASSRDIRLNTEYTVAEAQRHADGGNGLETVVYI
jgi:beta-glucosidase